VAATLFPVHAELTGSKAEFISGIFERFMLGDGHSTLNQYWT